MQEDHVPMIRAAVENAHEEGRRAASEELVAFLSKTQKTDNWLSDILKVLPLVTMIGGGIYAYTDLVKTVDKVSQRVEQDEKETTAVRSELIPIIRSNQAAAQAGAMVDKDQSSRIQSIADSVLQMRSSIETLAGTVRQMHEDMAVERAQRGLR